MSGFGRHWLKQSKVARTENVVEAEKAAGVGVAWLVCWEEADGVEVGGHWAGAGEYEKGSWEVSTVIADRLRRVLPDALWRLASAWLVNCMLLRAEMRTIWGPIVTDGRGVLLPEREIGLDAVARAEDKAEEGWFEELTISYVAVSDLDSDVAYRRSAVKHLWLQGPLAGSRSENEG